jgi:hypothetical protein
MLPTPRPTCLQPLPLLLDRSHEQPLYDESTMEEVVADSLGPKRLTLFLLAFLGSIALLHSSVGLYALLSYPVSHRPAMRSVSASPSGRSASPFSVWCCSRAFDWRVWE